MKGTRLFSAERDLFSRLRHHRQWPQLACCPWLLHQATGSTLGQRKYLPSCHTRGFPTSANFESKLSVKVLMWLANSRMPRSSCICLLLMYQGAPVARWRHLDCNTCSLRTWVGQRTPMQGTHSPSWGGWVAYVAGLCSWRRDHSFSSGGDPANASFEQPSSWPDHCLATRWVVYLGSPPDNELCRPIQLVPRRVLLAGTGWSTIGNARRLCRRIAERDITVTPSVTCMEWLRWWYENVADVVTS
jgi:hypothetical protein